MTGQGPAAREPAFTVSELGATAADVRGTVAPPPGSEPQAGGTVGRFFLLHPLGAGGMGVVWAAYDPQLDRKVALKLLHAEEGSSRREAGRLRLVREAQALARLSHPNVLAVHEVGTAGELVFMAEEFVHGVDLAQWLAAAPSGQRSQTEILGVFAQAARGLSAAHRAGVVHRDFKPANVMVGDDGRVRVADFGLARAAGSSEGPAVEAAPEQRAASTAPTAADALAETATPSASLAGLTPDSLVRRALALPLTRAGTVLGTPLYMAPEQHVGAPADERSDQFSFCVSLYEALYGERPFAGASAEELGRAVIDGQLREAPRRTRVPGWLRAVLLRGLRRRPEDRYPSMDALLAALARDPGAARRRWALGGGAAVLVVALLGGGVRMLRHRDPLCAGVERRLVGVWDPTRKAKVAAAFRGTSLPYAAHAWTTVERRLDHYAADWVAVSTAACEATSTGGAPAEELRNLQTMCLSQRLGELKATSDLFVAADAAVVEKAVQAAAALSPLSECRDVAALRAPGRPPQDAATRTVVVELRGLLARARAFEEAGRLEEGLRAAEAALARSREAAYAPVEAEALATRGQIEQRLGRNADAERSLERAFGLALSCHDEDVAARAGAALVEVAGDALLRFDEAQRWAALTRAVLAWNPRDDLNRARLANGLAATLRSRGRYLEALEQNRQAVALDEKALGPDHPETARGLNGLGDTLHDVGHFEDSLATYRRALAVRERVFGPDHPDVAASLRAMGAVLVDQGRAEEGRANLARALAILEHALGAEHPDVAAACDDLGHALHVLGQDTAALGYHRRALAILERTFGRDSAQVADSLGNIGLALRAQGHAAEALATLRHAVAIDEKALGRDHPLTAQMSGYVGEVYLDQAAFAAAVEHLERAVDAVGNKDHPQPDMLGEFRFALARALWSAGRDRRRALAVARQARADFAGLPARATEIAAIDSWLTGKR